MPSRTLTTTHVPRTYAELRRAVENTIIKGQREAELAKVRTYHETGRLIHEHVLLFKDRATRHAQTMQRLSEDLKMDRTVLLRCVQFYRAFPYVATWRHITWAHYRVLIPVEDVKLRHSLATEADQNEWPVARLEQRVRALRPSTPAGGDALKDVTPPRPLVPKRGTVGVWRVVAAGTGLAVDLGFTSYVDLPAPTRLKEGAFVQLDAAGQFVAMPDVSKAALYTYRAEVLRVVDGDTLWAKIYLEPGRWVKEKLRLRGLDCPEMNTAEGRAAKRFVEALVAKAKAVTVATFKPDKYDRYLADVFLDGEGCEPTFLNNELLANGHAVRKGEYALTDWGE
jgi:endonuclease YncB( thermonuclease family)